MIRARLDRTGPRAWLSPLVRGLVLVCAVFAAVAWPSRAQTGSAVSATGDDGQVLRLARPAARVVSLLPSLTESVCALGACARLVGVDRYSNEPASVRVLPRLGGGLDPNIEAIVALRPDLVLLAGSTRGADRLRGLGVPVLQLEPRSHADARRALVQIGRALGLPDAEAQAAWQRIDAGLDQVARAWPAAARGLRVYVEVGGGPYAAGEASFMGETLARLGLRNVVPSALGPFPRLNPEFIVRADPDLILVADDEGNGVATRPGWAGLRAVRAGRICRFDAVQADILVRPGPRLPEAARLVLDCVRSRVGDAR